MCINSKRLESALHLKNTLKNQKLAAKPHSVLDKLIFLASLDCTKATLVQVMHIVAPVLKAVGIDIKDMTLPTSSIYS